MKMDKIDIIVSPGINKMDIVDGTALRIGSITRDQINEILDSVKDSHPPKIRLCGITNPNTKQLIRNISNGSGTDKKEQRFRNELPNNPQDITIEFIEDLLDHDKATALKIVDTLITLWKIEFFGIVPGQKRAIQ